MLDELLTERPEPVECGGIRRLPAVGQELLDLGAHVELEAATPACAQVPLDPAGREVVEFPVEVLLQPLGDDVAGHGGAKPLERRATVHVVLLGAAGASEVVADPRCPSRCSRRPGRSTWYWPAWLSSAELP